MKPSISLWFNGDCAAALHFYEQCLPAKITFTLTWGDSPMANEAPPQWRTKICHATLVLAETTFHGCDVLPGSYQPPAGFSIALNIDDTQEADRVFGALSAGGQVRMALCETFWARRYGVVVDRFGVPWEINCER